MAASLCTASCTGEEFVTLDPASAGAGGAGTGGASGAAGAGASPGGSGGAASGSGGSVGGSGGASAQGGGGSGNAAGTAGGASPGGQAGLSGAAGVGGSPPQGGNGGQAGVAGACSANFADCDGDPGNGCETSTADDPAHCGGCSMACVLSQATPRCLSGACAIDTCNAGYKDCDGSASNGCEAFTDGDVNNCGSCGNVCPSSTGTNPSCVKGVCGVSSCSLPLANCDSSADGSCEVDLSSDLSHCGACGKACSFPHASGVCSGGDCSLGTCKGLYADCNGKPADGCESDTATDTSNCGSCGTVCSVANGTSSCAGGACVFGGCLPGFVDLDGKPGNGCEYQCPVSPKGSEVCNGLDDDCDGVIDNGLMLRDVYLDEDGDGYGNPGKKIKACSAGPGYSLVAGDCDDTAIKTSPAAPEACGDNVDNNCNGVVDETSACCPDADGDGFFSGVCGGLDCDDKDPGQNTGEICDGVDNDCDGIADNACGATLYVSASTGNDMTGTGTMLSPFRTISKALQLAGATKAASAIHIAEGDYVETVTASEGISLLGGYQCSNDPCEWIRSPLQHPSRLIPKDGHQFTLTIPPSVTNATRIDGLRILGSSVSSADFSGSDLGAAAVKIAGTPIFSNNVVTGPKVSGSTLAHRAIGVLVTSSSSSPQTQPSLLVGNVVVGGDVGNYAIAPGILVGVQGGGLAPPLTLLTSNTVLGGSGRSASGLVVFSSAPGSRLSNSRLFAGQSDTVEGYAVDLLSTMILDRNQLNVGSPQLPTSVFSVPSACLGSPGNQDDFFCGGLRASSATATITNNVIFGINAPRSTAVKLVEVENPVGSIVLNGNVLQAVGNAAQNTTCTALAMSFSGCLSGACGQDAVFGSLRNNILVGAACTSAFVVYEAQASGQNNAKKTAHPAAFTHNALFLPSSGHVYRFWDGQSSQSVATVAQIPGLPFPKKSNVKNLLGESCPLDASFHLSVVSPCVNAGTSIEAPPFDLDGGLRPSGTGIDIGADEAF